MKSTAVMLSAFLIVAASLPVDAAEPASTAASVGRSASATAVKVGRAASSAATATGRAIKHGAKAAASGVESGVRAANRGADKLGAKMGLPPGKAPPPTTN